MYVSYKTSFHYSFQSALRRGQTGAGLAIYPGNLPSIRFDERLPSASVHFPDVFAVRPWHMARPADTAASVIPFFVLADCIDTTP